MKNNQKGFSAVEGLLIVVIVAMLGGVGWYVWHSQKQVDKIDSQTANSSAAPTTKPATTKQSTAQAVTLDNGAVQFTPSDIWKVEAIQGDTTKVCGQTVTSSEVCTDSKILTLKSENNFSTYNTDSFYVEIASFNNSGKNAKDWLASALDEGIDAEVSDSQYGASYKNLTINSLSAGRFERKPDPSNANRVDINYSVVSPTKAALVSAEVFKGDHYSFKNTTDYTKYSSDIDALAKTIKINK